MDTIHRLKGLYKDLKIDKEYLIDYMSGKDFGLNIWKELSRLVDELIETPDKMTGKLNKGFKEQLSRSIENPILSKGIFDRKWMGCGKLNDVIFFTGATGFIGTQIVRRLIKKGDTCIIVLVRGKTFEYAYRHLSRSWWEWPDLMEEIEGLKKFNIDDYRDNKINLINGDITVENLGLDDYIYNFLVDNLTHLVHTAADIRLNASLEDLRRINVHGTENLIKLATDAHKNHGISRFSHLSTAYVAGGRTGNISEDSLNDNGRLS